MNADQCGEGNDADNLPINRTKYSRIGQRLWPTENHFVGGSCNFDSGRYHWRHILVPRTGTAHSAKSSTILHYCRDLVRTDPTDTSLDCPETIQRDAICEVSDHR